MKLSVIITTKNRPELLRACVASIHKNTYKKAEIIIIDQSTRDTKSVRSALTNPRRFSLRYIKSVTQNLSQGKNEGIRMASGDICVFTDDDCIASPGWLATIASTFAKHPKVTGVFGATKPYRAPEHAGQRCPSVTPTMTAHTITRPQNHWQGIGFGNNMAFRKHAFSLVGTFKHWLGPGSVGGSAEDAEFALRLLIHGGALYFNPQAKVYHDKWLTDEKAAQSDLVYVRGEMACYGYFYFQRHAFATPVVENNLRRFGRNVGKKIFWKHDAVSLMYELQHVLSATHGLLIGAYYAWRDNNKRR